MRVLHLVPLHVPSPGIVNQALAEREAAASANLPWDVRLFTDAPLPAEAESLRAEPATAPPPAHGPWIGYALDKVRQRGRLYRWLEKASPHYDVILLRHTYADIARRRALVKLDTPVVSVHHTLEVPELRLAHGAQGRIRATLESWCGPRSIRASAGVIGVTDEIRRYELDRAGVPMPSAVLPNGIDVDSQPLLADERTDVPHLLFVASYFYPWHGLDRLLAALARTRTKFVLDLVGELSATDAAAAARDDRVRVHGLLSREQIRPIAAKAWAGLSSFALERKSMHEACTLKVREYLAGGLPTYAGHEDQFPADAPYFACGPADIDRILEYATQQRRVSRERIREQSRSAISKAAILRRSYQQLETMVSTGPSHGGDGENGDDLRHRSDPPRT